MSFERICTVRPVESGESAAALDPMMITIRTASGCDGAIPSVVASTTLASTPRAVTVVVFGATEEDGAVVADGTGGGGAVDGTEEGTGDAAGTGVDAQPGLVASNAISVIRYGCRRATPNHMSGIKALAPTCRPRAGGGRIARH